MMLLLLILGTLMALLVAATLIGRRLPSSHAVASRIQLHRSPAEVWNTLTDRTAYPEWRPGLASVKAGPDIEGRATWFEVCKRSTRVQFREIECQAPRRLVTGLVGDNLPLQGSWTYELDENPEGCRLTITEREEISNPVIRFFFHYVLSYHGPLDVFLISLSRKFDENTHPEHLSADGESPV